MNLLLKNVYHILHTLLTFQPRPTLFGELTDDISNHEFLALRLRVAGHPRTRNSYYVNVQTDSPVSGELWQHRLYFQRDDGGWEDVFVRRLLLFVFDSSEIDTNQYLSQSPTSMSITPQTKNRFTTQTPTPRSTLPTPDPLLRFRPHQLRRTLLRTLPILHSR